MKKVIKKVKFVVFSFAILAALGFLNNNGIINLGFQTNNICEAAIFTSDDGLWKFNNDGTIYVYLGSDSQITIPSELTANNNIYTISQIPSTAFANNNSITQINIGANITVIGDSPFQQMDNLTAIEVDPANANYCDINGILYNKAQTILMRYPQMNSTQVFEFPSTFEEFNIDALEVCNNVQTLRIPSYYTGYINTENSEMFSTVFPNLTNIQVMQGNANYSCEDGVLYNSDKTILLWYPSKKNATDFTIPSSVTTLSASSFINVAFLQNINLTANITTIEKNCFNGCALTSINNISTRAEYINWNSDIKSVFQEYLENFQNQPVVISLVNEEVQYAVDSFIEDNMTNYEKIKALYDYVSNRVSYDYDNMYAGKNHCIPSVFLNNKTVCEGYALAMTLLLDKAGITNIPVSGPNHAWNIVQINDIWLQIDATWDDIGSEARIEYFLRTADEYNQLLPLHPVYESIKQAPFSNYSFTADRSMYENNLPLCNAIIGDVNTDGVLDQSDLDAMPLEILTYSLYNINGYYNVKADLNRDGIIDSTDYNILYDLIY